MYDIKYYIRLSIILDLQKKQITIKNKIKKNNYRFLKSLLVKRKLSFHRKQTQNGRAH